MILVRSPRLSESDMKLALMNKPGNSSQAAVVVMGGARHECLGGLRVSRCYDVSMLEGGVESRNSLQRRYPL